jgi:hypothetical protein
MNIVVSSKDRMIAVWENNRIVAMGKAEIENSMRRDDFTVFTTE